jgi:hypothetical protein
MVHDDGSGAFSELTPRDQGIITHCSRFRAILSIADSGYRTRYPLVAVDRSPLLDGSTAGELILELAHHGLQQLIELEVVAVLGDDRHERTGERLCLLNGFRTPHAEHPGRRW